MRAVVFDIETVGCEFDDLDTRSQEYFLRFCHSGEEVREAKEGLSFYPLTAEVVALAMLDAETREGAVYFQAPGHQGVSFKDGEVRFFGGDERMIVTRFWQQLSRFDQFVTFNGRHFDGPFLMIRSAILGVRVGSNLVPYRYSAERHVDLADQLSCYDSLRRRFPLHFWCQAFGIESPKMGGVDGHGVGDLFRQGHYEEIARYCLGDVRATCALFDHWKRYMADSGQSR